MYIRNSHCSFCGHTFAPEQPWPRTCKRCQNTSYRNPLPVAVVLLPVDSGLLVVRRAIAPQVGELALPGGYIGVGESWQAAGARELLEETGISIDPGTIADFHARSAPDGTLLVFGLAPAMRAADLPPFAPNAEASERLVLPSPTPLAFSLHTEAAAAFFSRFKAF